MNMRFVNVIFFCLLVSPAVFALDSAYEGENGIRAKVFATNCLFCHSSELSGSARNGAPNDVNWDTYEAALPNADRAVVRAVEQMTMPPSFSGLPTLNQEQKDAMLAWQDAGFPQFSTQAMFDFSTLLLTLPVVIVGDVHYSAELQLFDLPGSDFGVGFKLVSADMTDASSATAVTFNPETGVVVLPDVELINSNDVSSKISAQMQLIPGPVLQFELTSLTFLN